MGQQSNNDAVIAGNLLENEKLYWSGRLAGALIRTELPFKKGGNRLKQDLKTVDFTIDEAVCRKILKVCKGSDHGLFMILHAVVSILLHKYTGNDTIVVETPINKQENQERYINTRIPLLQPIETNLTFKEFLIQTKTVIQEAYDNCNYPINKIYEMLGTKRAAVESPLTDIAIVLENIHETGYYHESGCCLKLIFARTGVGLKARFEYDSSRCEPYYIKQMFGHFMNVLKQVSANPNVALALLEMTTAEEQNQLLNEFNNTAADYQKNKTIPELFAEQVIRTPANIALVYQDQKITYRELDTRAERLAGTLRLNGVGPESIVALILERSVEMIISILAILKAGGAYLPIDPEYPRERIQYMLEDSKTKVLVTQDKMAVAEFGGQVIWVDNEAGADCNGREAENQNTPESLAYVIYTSGSTGRPKGVMVEHRGLANLREFFKQTLKVNETDRILQFASVSFDASVWEIFMALLAGAALYLVPKDVINNLRSMEAFLGENEITIATLPPNYLANLNLEANRSLRTLITAGSATTHELVNQWGKRLEYLNAYGPTETTICATICRCDRDYQELSNIPIGKPIHNTQVYILDERLKCLPVGVEGEIYISGAGVGRGYWGQPDLTAEKFLDNPFWEGKKLYRTGDLGRVLPDGNIEFLGRVDHQVKIRGFRIELGEIENQLLRLEGVKEAVVVKLEEHEDHYLCAYYVAERKYSAAELGSALKKSLPEYMIPAYLIALDRMPVNHSGKIDRKALPHPSQVETRVSYEAAGNPIEAKLAAIWQELLGREQIGINDNFFEIGGHSLSATILGARIDKELNSEIPLDEIFRLGTIKAMSEYLTTHTGSNYAPIAAVEAKEFYEASPAQKRMYVLQELAKESTAYNICGALILEGKVDIAKIEQVFKKLLARHEAFRTCFETQDEILVQRIQKSQEIKFTLESSVVSEETEVAEKAKSFCRAFDLSKAPLLRGGIIKLTSEKYLLLIDMHHIIADGISLSIITKEFGALYSGKELQPLRIHYKDYAAWQSEMMGRGEFQKQEQYWLNKYQGELPVLNMATDFDRPAVQSFEGDSLSFKLSTELTGRLQEITKDTGSTLYMLLLAAAYVLFSKYSGQEDIIIGCDIAGRRHADLENVVGMFVNTLALRNCPQGEKSFTEFLKEVKDNTLKAYENQDYPFEQLVEKLNLPRDFSRNPLFDVMFAMANLKAEELALADVTIRDYELKDRTTQFEIMIAAIEVGDEIRFVIDYATKLYKPETMLALAGHYQKLLEVVALDRNIKLKDIEILTEQEKRQILAVFNDTDAPYPEGRTFPELFKAQVEKTPDAVAVSYREQQLTYRELDQKADQIARLLREKGLQRDGLVGILLERSIDMLAAILGIFKAGGAYIPLDANYPPSRVKAILADSGAGYLLAKSTAVKDRAGFYAAMADGTRLGQIIYLDQIPDANRDNGLFRTLKLAQWLMESGAPEITERITLYAENKVTSDAEYRKKVIRLHEWLQNYRNGTKAKIGVIVKNPVPKIIAVTALRKGNMPFTVIDPQIKSVRKREMIISEGIGLVISENECLDEVDRLFWLIPDLKTYVSLDEEDAYEKTKEKSFKALWNVVAEETTEAINDYGWINSYDGERFTLAEMREYIDNFVAKLQPYLKRHSRVFDIGCGHGLALFAIAPKVKEYFATDLSEAIIAKNRSRIARERLNNVILETAAASEIASMNARGYDVVVCCSVIHYFPNTVYLEKVIRGALAVLGDQGVIYLDDVMDLEKRAELVEAVMAYKRNHPSARTKLEWDDDLFVHQDFFRFIGNRYPEVVEIQISRKMGQIENELTKYRYDVLLKVDKKSRNNLLRKPLPKQRYFAKDIAGYQSRVRDNGFPVPEEADRKRQYQIGAVCDGAALAKAPAGKVALVNRPADLCYVIYTSGSTGKPKGVMVEHAGMINHLFAKINDLNLSATSIIAQNASHCFDISVWQFLAPLVCGGKTVIYPDDAVMNGQRFTKLIERDHLTILEVVPSYLEVLIEHLAGSPNRLESLKYLLVTGEEVQAALVKKWFDLYPEIKMVNAYGPTEASDDITHHIMDCSPKTTLIPIGKPLQNLKIYIMDEYLKLCPAGVKGEIVVSGIGVGRGYLNDLAKTRQAFGLDPFAPEPRRMYKTGDLGRWLPDGKIEFFGRKDSQVKIRGFRIEPGEIESKLLRLDGVKSAVVIDRKDAKGFKYLCAYLVGAARLDFSKVKEDLQEILPEYMIPSYFVRLERVPLTANGKIDRKALPEPGRIIDTGVGYEAARNPVEAKLVTIWRELLDLDQVGINDDLFELGGHSLMATILGARIAKEFNIEIPLGAIFRLRTIRGMSGYIAAHTKSGYEEIPRADAKEYYEASPAQKRMYLAQEFDKTSIAYNVPEAIEVKDGLELDRVRECLVKLLKRHEPLRTGFQTVNGLIVQKIQRFEEIDFTMEKRAVPDEAAVPECIRTFVRPFDLSVAPLFRVGIITVAEDRRIMLFDLHHIIADGVSLATLTWEFGELYSGRELPPLRIQYKDYSEWQKRRVKAEQLQEEYWFSVFRDKAPMLDLPLDHPRPAVRSFAGNYLEFGIGTGLTGKLNELTKKTGTTLYMVLLAALNILLSKYSGQDDIIVGSPVAGREHSDVEKMLGVFINTLAMRNRPQGAKTFNVFLNEVRENTLRALENQSYPFDALVDRLNLKRDMSRNPLFDVMFVMQNTGRGRETELDRKFTPYFFEHKIAKFDILLDARELAGEICCRVEYCVELFQKPTIEKMVQNFWKILEIITGDREIKIRNIGILDSGEAENVKLKLKQALGEIENQFDSLNLEDAPDSGNDGDASERG